MPIFLQWQEGLARVHQQEQENNGQSTIAQPSATVCHPLGPCPSIQCLPPLSRLISLSPMLQAELHRS